MATTALGGNPVHTVGDLPQVGTAAPAFTLTGSDFSEVALGAGGTGRKTVLNIFPSVDTGICAASVRTFNEAAAGLDGVDVINVSADLPFAQARFCGAEGIDNVVVASTLNSSFGTDYGVQLTDGKFKGLLARSIVVLDADGSVLYSAISPEIGEAPDHESALAALG